MNGGFMSSLFGKKGDEEELTNFGLARVFKYEELKKATNSVTTELGIGGFGSVYLGTLRDGQMVAVKVLHNHNPRRLQQFVNETIVLSRLRHKNLVTLYGCRSPRGKELLLVYEYVPNSTVEDHLHGQRSDITLAVRVQIAVETAEALAYLHALIHRDVKTSNIMPDHAFHVKVGYLGMCRLLPWDPTQVLTVPQGTMSYRDPEYDRTLILTAKSDVYSFGVVLVELMSGQKAVDVDRGPDNIYLVGLVLDKIINKKLDEFVDPKLQYNSSIHHKRVINSIADLAVKCLHSTCIMRPTMNQVLTELKQIYYELQHIGALNIHQQELGDKSLIDGSEATIHGASRLSFRMKDILRARAEEMARGNIGITYRVMIEYGPVIIVKRLKDMSALSKKEFRQQMQLLWLVKHENLVLINAFYNYQDEKLVIYENVPGANFYKLLHDNRRAGKCPLNWAARLSIVKGMARGLAHLHSVLPSLKVPHANLKSPNVLVVQNNRHDPATYHAKLTDFGFLPFLQSPAQAGKLAIASTPKLWQEKNLSQKTDIYCFGLVLLEVITGQAPGEEDLSEWVRSAIQTERMRDIFDLDIAAEVDGHEGMLMLTKIALKCTSAEPERQPKMSELLQMIEEIREPYNEEGS